MPKRTWDEKYTEWARRSRWTPNPKIGMRFAYHAGRKHQRKVCNENTAKLTMKLKALLKETLESSDALTVSANRLGAENRALKMERHSLLIDLNVASTYRRSLVDEISELEAQLAPKWWQFWRKA